MGLFGGFFRPTGDGNAPESEEKNSGTGVVDGQHDGVDAPNNDLYSSSDGGSISSGYDGVKKAQATTIVWTRNALIIAYLMYSTPVHWKENLQTDENAGSSSSSSSIRSSSRLLALYSHTSPAPLGSMRYYPPPMFYPH
jgi:hypothetical protein